MKTKLTTKLFTLCLSAILVLCMSVVAFANGTQTDSTALSYLTKAVQNSNNTQNLSFKGKFELTTPLANATANLNGKFAKPLNLSGDLSLVFDVLIADSKFNFDSKIYSELNNNQSVQYMQVKSNPQIDSLDPNKWYKQSSEIPAQLLESLLPVAEENTPDNSLLENIKALHLVSDSKNTATLHVVYNRPLFDEKVLAELTAKAKNDPTISNESNATTMALLNSAELQAAFAKARDLELTITIDKKNMQISQIDADLTQYLVGLSNDIIDNLPLDKMYTDKQELADAQNLLTMGKSFISNSTCKLSIKISDVNKTTVKTLSQKDKDGALPFPDLTASDDAAEEAPAN